MSSIRRELINAVLHKVIHAIDSTDVDKWYELEKETLLADESLTDDEKSESIRMLTERCDIWKTRDNKGKKRVCENCKQECLAISYCELCIRNHLKENFSNWTSGNNEIDNLIRKCQMESYKPHTIMEWISYNNLQNIKYLTKGGCSEIYTADWIGGSYKIWDSKDLLLKRKGRQEVILKKLENFESAKRSWF